MRKKKEQEGERRLSTVEWMTALTLGGAGVPIDTALEMAGVVRDEYGSLVPTEANLRRLVARVRELKGTPANPA